jgi:uncharacterized membrane protein (UPF0127 family)
MATAINTSRDTELVRDLETAGDFWARFMGLMGRPSLGEGGGLWIPGANGIHMMFMRFPIDAVFLGRPSPDGARPVVAIREALPAWTGLVPLVRGADGVLELPAGTVARTSTALGDLVRLETAAA